MQNLAPDANTDDQSLSAGHVRVVPMLALGLLLAWLSIYWVRQAEVLSVACSVTGAVPSIPSLAVLLLLPLVNRGLRHVRAVRELSTGEIVLVYVITTVTVMMYGIGGMRHLLAAMSEIHYLSSAAEPIDTLAPLIPTWLSPESTEVHRQMWEGSPSGNVPWGVWRLPVVSWTGIFLLMGGTVISLLLIVADRWLAHERLTFPLARLPLELLGAGAIGPFFRNRIAWLGMGIATVRNAINMVRGVFLGGPGYGGPVFTVWSLNLGYPWRALAHVPILLFALRPGLIGLGYLVSNEVAISVIVFYILNRIAAVVMAAAGYKQWDVPYSKQQTFGGYVAMGLSMLWASRGTIRRAWDTTFSRERSEGADSSHVRWASIGAVVCAAGVLIFWVSAGMAPWLAALYMAILTLTSIGYARVRAETGVPLLWARPYGTEYLGIWDALGGARIVPPGRSLRSPTLFAMTSFLSRTGFPSASGYEIEGVRLCRQTGVTWSQTATALMLAIGVGIVGGFVLHLAPFYQKGAISLPGGSWNYGGMRQTYARVLQNAQSPGAPSIAGIVAPICGGLITLLVAAARSHWTGFPLHPVGYLVASCEYACWLFPTFVIVWLCKTVILRYGGNRAYRAFLPAFLGLALGHFLSGGLVWGSLSALLGGPFMRWAVWVN